MRTCNARGDDSLRRVLIGHLCESDEACMALVTQRCDHSGDLDTDQVNIAAEKCKGDFGCIRRFAEICRRAVACDSSAVARLCMGDEICVTSAAAVCVADPHCDMFDTRGRAREMERTSRLIRRLGAARREGASRYHLIVAG
jgi:hypothetical protein